MWGQQEGATESERGFTLVELLVSIVVVGILTAVAIVGISGLTDKGSDSACLNSRDAATAASLVYYSNTGGQYPQNFDQLAHPPSGEPTLDVSAAQITSPTTLRGKDGWTLTLQPGATVSERTKFAC